VKICVHVYIPNLKRASDWLTPFSIALTLLITFLTTEFSKDFIGISKSFWAISFIIAFAALIIWLIMAITNCYRLRKFIDIEYLVDKIKNKN
jgi:hypothetical protein